jgi:hypothetical protein
VFRRAVQTAFRSVARVRAGRALHTSGVSFDARLTLDPGSLLGSAVGGPPSRPAVVRLSKAVGLPAGLPDLLGVAVRVEAGDGLLDVLMTSTGRWGPGRFVLLPSGRWWAAPCSTLLPYRACGQLVLPGADGGDGPREVPADPARAAESVRERPVRMAVTELPLRDVLSRPRTVGELALESVRAPEQALDYDPVLNRLPDLHPVRPLTALRERAYTGSRRGRHAEPADLRVRP